MDNNVRSARKRKGLTIEDLHKRSGVSCGYISDIEAGKCIPSIVIARKLACALHANVDVLFPDAKVMRYSDIPAEAAGQ